MRGVEWEKKRERDLHNVETGFLLPALALLQALAAVANALELAVGEEEAGALDGELGEEEEGEEALGAESARHVGGVEDREGEEGGEVAKALLGEGRDEEGEHAALLDLDEEGEEEGQDRPGKRKSPYHVLIVGSSILVHEFSNARKPALLLGHPEGVDLKEGRGRER